MPLSCMRNNGSRHVTHGPCHFTSNCAWEKNVFWVAAIFRANVYASLKLSFTFSPKGQIWASHGTGGRNTICHFLGRWDKSTLVHIQRLLLHLEGRPNRILHVNKLFTSTFHAFTTKWITTSGTVLTFEAFHQLLSWLDMQHCSWKHSLHIIHHSARMWCALLLQFQL